MAVPDSGQIPEFEKRPKIRGSRIWDFSWKAGCFYYFNELRKGTDSRASGCPGFGTPVPDLGFLVEGMIFQLIQRIT